MIYSHKQELLNLVEDVAARKTLSEKLETGIARELEEKKKLFEKNSQKK